MKYLSSFLIATLILTGCATATTPPVPDAPKADLLIISPQGVSPAADTAGFNNLTRNVTQAFAGKLSAGLQEKKSLVNIIDQDPKYNVGQKLAIYSVRHSSKSAIVLSVETETVGSDNRLLLKAQYIEQEFIVENGKLKGVRPTSTLEKSYVLRSSITGDNQSTMTTLAEDYVKFLKNQGRM